MSIHTALTRLSKLSSRFPAIAVFLLALLLGLSSLNRGLQSDDYIHRNILMDEHTELYEKLKHFYAFFEHSELSPWWADQALKVHFWRPFSALTHWLDYQLWPEKPMMMHLHNMLWYSLLCLLVLSLFRKLLPLSTAVFGTLLFTLDFSHFANLSWLASRNSLISACFIVASLMFYINWRQKQKTSDYAASLFILCIGLLSGEISIVTPALIMAYELSQLSDRQLYKSIKRSSFVSVYFIIAGIWYYSYQAFGFGSNNNSIYISPTEDIVHSMTLILEKTPVFIFSNLTGIDGFYNVFADEIQLLISIACFVFLLLGFWFLYESIKSRQTKFFLLAAILVLPPVCLVSMLDMRLGLLSSVFTAALLSILIIHLVQIKQRSLIKQALLGLLLVLHVLIAATQWIHVGLRDALHPQKSFHTLQTLRHDYPDETLYILNYPSPIETYYFPYVVNNTGAIHTVLPNYANYDLKQLSPLSYEMYSNKGFVFKNSDFKHYALKEKPKMHGVYANSTVNSIVNRDFRFTKGDYFQQADVGIHILETNKAGLATHIQLVFHGQPGSFRMLLWNSQLKQFQALGKLFDTRDSLSVTNWTP